MPEDGTPPIRSETTVRVSPHTSTIARLALAMLLSSHVSMSQSAEMPMPLTGTGWTLATLPGRTLIANSSVTLQFDAAGRVSGTDGCNRYSGTYLVNGSALLVSPLASTRMACPPELTSQGAAFTSALTQARSYRLTNGRLELLASDGTVRATLAARSRELPGTSWNATGINNGRAAVTSLVQGTHVTLAFGTDGRASGSAGCNNYTAPYTVDGSVLRLGPAAATRLMCAQPGVMEQEQAFLKALETVATAQFDANLLFLRTASDEIAAIFSRAPEK
jgi:heat shock protein HslJ